MKNNKITMYDMGDEYISKLDDLNNVLERAYEILNISEAFRNGALDQGWSLSRPNEDVAELLDDAKEIVQLARSKTKNLDSKFSKEEIIKFLEDSNWFLEVSEELKNKALDLEDECFADEEERYCE